VNEQPPSQRDPRGRDPFWTGFKIGLGCLTVIIATPIVLFVVWLLIGFFQGLLGL
jgi:hypothetical protein